jgi:cytochrome c oxidase cbb3-type subunit 3
MWKTSAFLLLASLLIACSKEGRRIGPALPQSPPVGNEDARIPAYQDNLDQVSQGERYFAWYGCSACHDERARGVTDLSDGRWLHGAGFADVFAAIAHRHGPLRFGARIPVEQIWQLTAFVRDLPTHHPEKRNRVALDQLSEPVGNSWSGPR